MQKTNKKNKIRRKFLVIKGEVFKFDLVIGLGVTREELIEYTESEFINPLTQEDKERLLGGTPFGKAVRLSNRAMMLWTRDYPKNPFSFATLCHEIFHIADFVCDSIGIHDTVNADEVWAHLISWYTEIIFREFELHG